MQLKEKLSTDDLENYEVPTDDLGYEGRARKRPPGASELVQRIYGLLLEHPEGLTIDQIHDHFREGWADNDAYRAYEKQREREGPNLSATHYNDKLGRVRRRPPKKVGGYGTPDFKERAQRWWLSKHLTHMHHLGTARREGKGKEARWYPGNRAPRAIIACEVPGKGYHVAPLDAARAKALIQADTAAHVRREEVKAAVLQGLSNKKLKVVEARELLQLAYDYIAGR